MGRGLNKLSVRKIAALNAPGMYGDGGNLWLQVSPSGGKKLGFQIHPQRQDTTGRLGAG